MSEREELLTEALLNLIRIGGTKPEGKARRKFRRKRLDAIVEELLALPQDLSEERRTIQLVLLPKLKPLGDILF